MMVTLGYPDGLNVTLDSATADCSSDQLDDLCNRALRLFVEAVVTVETLEDQRPES